MKIEKHLDHYENPAMCIDPDNCPVVYASLMQDYCMNCGYREDLHPIKGVFLTCNTFEMED